jgi:hypothetical protein
MQNELGNKTKSWLLIVVFGLIVIGILAALRAAWIFDSFSSSRFPFRPLPPSSFNPADLEFYYIAKTVVSTINIALLVFLIVTHATIYSKTRAQFTIGLLLFAVVFLMKEVTSSPLVSGVFGFSPSGLGPFALLPDVFEFAALSVLLYLSVKY